MISFPGYKRDFFLINSIVHVNANKSIFIHIIDVMSDVEGHTLFDTSFRNENHMISLHPI